ncbi:MAG: MucB/RseB C-terminal domain-containing protein [Burkholderiales bacterium]|jgi:sigma-E factor negative regulatory protein RseB|nr:MucB/RseB C-terminal domain-containing protein [Burkholderiales bacterium]
MRRAALARWRWLASAVWALAFASLAQGQEQASGASTAAGADARSPEQWLQVIQQAARRLDYSGTMVYQQGAEVRMSRIVHVFDGKVSHERLQPMDGHPREFIRRADEVKCLIPEAKRVVIERRTRAESFPGLAATSTAELLQHYQVKVVGRERVGGFDCQVLEIRPRQTDRYGYRLWVDRNSGLLLRSQTIDGRDEVLEQMAFAEIHIGTVDRELLKPSWPIDGWKVDEAAHRPVDLKEQGWRLVPPAGFKPLYAVRRPMASGSALQAVYSDGLASLSVFIEPASASDASEALAPRGPINAYARRVGDSMVTVVGEIPVGTARAVADASERIGR